MLYRINRDVRVANKIFMDNEPVKNDYNKETKGVTRLERIDVRTNETHSPCQNKTESVINIIKGKERRIRVQINIPKRIWDFGSVWKGEIYSRTVARNDIFSLKLRYYVPKGDIFDYWGKTIFGLLYYYIL